MNEWLTSNNVSDELKETLKSYNEKQLNIALNNKVTFGTAGLRGTMGAGYGFINENIINWATIGYAKYLLNKNSNPKVVIAYDNRRNSQNFAKLCAKILSSFKIEVYIFENLTSTPELSFTIRRLNADGGINITASHNPKDDNGYKLYNSQGGQYLPADIDEIKNYIDQITSPIDVAICEKENQNYINVITNHDEFINFVAKNIDSSFEKYEHILISTLHGCGQIIEAANNKIQFENIAFVASQLNSDPNFTTAPSPNPDTLTTYEYAINNNPNCKYILATDPDADRVGMYDVLHKTLYTGNQIATLLLNYLLETNSYDKNQTVIASNVSSMLPVKMAKAHNLNTEITLTGFKWIGQIMDESFLFGYEESNGFLLHKQTRDKDGVVAAFKLIEMINYYYNKNQTLYDVLDSIYKKYGYHLDTQVSIVVDDLNVVNEVTSKINLDTFEGILYIEDYNTLTRTYKTTTTKLVLPQNNMLKIVFDDESFIAIRPSGTEPKIKAYCNAVGTTKDHANSRLQQLRQYSENLF